MPIATIIQQPTEPEVRARLAVQIAFTCERMGLDTFDMNACVTLGIRYWEFGHSPASAYWKAVQTAHNAVNMNQVIQQMQRGEYVSTTHH